MEPWVVALIILLAMVLVSAIVLSIYVWRGVLIAQQKGQPYALRRWHWYVMTTRKLEQRRIRKLQAKSIHIVSGVSRSELNDAKTRGREDADNRGQIRYIDPVILASLDPEKPVSSTTIDLASLPDGFDLDQEMQWYISGLALGFGVDYQEFAPLPGGNIGSGSQSNMLHRKSSGKGPRNWMNMIAGAFKNYGVLPRCAEMIFNDKNEQEEIERQEVRTRAMEEAAIAARSKIFPRRYIAEDLVRRGIFHDISAIPEDFWDDEKQAQMGRNAVGQIGPLWPIRMPRQRRQPRNSTVTARKSARTGGEPSRESNRVLAHARGLLVHFANP